MSNGMNYLPPPGPPPAEFAGVGRPITGGSDPGITPRFILNVVRRWWRIALLLGVLMSAMGGTAILLLVKPTYEATTLLMIRPEYIVFKDQMDMGSFVRTQQELVKSPPVLTEVLADPEITGLPIFDGEDDRIGFLRKNVLAGPVGGSQLFQIKMTSEHQDAVHKVVNRIREAYLALVNSEENRRTESTLNSLQAEKEKRFKDIETERNNLKNLAKAKGITLPSTLEGGNLQRTAKVMETLKPTMTLQGKLAEFEIEIAMMEAGNLAERRIIEAAKPQVDPKAVRQAIGLDPAVLTLLGKIEEQKTMLAVRGESQSAGAKQKIADEIKRLEEELKGTEEQLTPEIEKQMLAEIEQAQQERLAEMEKNLDLLRIGKQSIEEKLGTEQKQLNVANESTLEIEFKQQDLQRKEAILDKISDRIDQIKTESSRKSDITILSHAERPVLASGSSPLKLAVPAMIVLLFVPMLLFFLWELKSRRVGDVAEFVVASNLPVVGEIATLPIRSRFLPRSNQRFEETLSRFEESVEYLRTSILFQRHGRKLKSLVVCSSASREGKSTVAAHLSSSLARTVAGRVLLVDGDMRRPSLHRLLDQGNEAGLVDYLAGRNEYTEVIRETWVEKLDFVPAGSLDVPVAVLLSNDRMKSFLEKAEKFYEFVIIDVPPILPVSDGLVIAREADGAIFCGLRDVSTIANVTRACDRLRSAGVNVVGTVFNGTPSRHYGSAGGYYYRIRQPQRSQPT